MPSPGAAAKATIRRRDRRFTETIRLKPEIAAAYWYRGDIWRMKGDLEQAIADCTEAIRVDPKCAPPMRFAVTFTG